MKLDLAFRPLGGRLLGCVLCVAFSGILHPETAFSQPSNLDSLYSVWEDESLPPGERSRAYYKYIWDGYLNSNPDSALVLGDQLLSFGEEYSDPYATFKYYDLRGLCFAMTGNFVDGLIAREKALEIAKESGDTLRLLEANGNMGNLHHEQGNFFEAYHYYEICAGLCEALGNKFATCRSYYNLGNIHMYQGNKVKALQLFSQAEQIGTEIEDHEALGAIKGSKGLIYMQQEEYGSALDLFESGLKHHEVINNLHGQGLMFDNIGSVHHHLENDSLALSYFQKGLELMTQVGDPAGIALAYNHIGWVHRDNDDNEQAMQNYEKGLEICREFDVLSEEPNLLNQLGNLQYDIGDYEEAYVSCKEAFEKAASIGLVELEKDACECLAKAGEARGTLDDALFYTQRARMLTDSIDATATSKELQRSEFNEKLQADSIAQAEEMALIQLAHGEDLGEKEAQRNIFIIIGLIAAAVAFLIFFILKKTRKAKAASELILDNVLPTEISEELKAKGTADAKSFDQATILFSDFKGFTKMSEEMSSDELLKEINHCFQAFDHIVGKYGIEKIKTIGDAYMAAGGLPNPGVGLPHEVVQAGLEMQEFITNRKKEREAENLPAFVMRIGIHTGPVIAGIVGVKKYQYDVWGDTVNTASRMESSGEAGMVNISEATYELVKNQEGLAFESRGKIEAKGKGEMEMYFVSRALLR